MTKVNGYLRHRAAVAWVTTSILLVIHSQASGVHAADATDQKPATSTNVWAEIRVVDSDTGRGVPLVELETVNSLKFVTDNAGRVAFYEPGQMGREVFFSVRSHGYEMKKVGFGFALRPNILAVSVSRSV